MQTQQFIEEHKKSLEQIAIEMLSSCIKDIDFCIALEDSDVEENDELQILIDAKSAIQTYIYNKSKSV